MNRFAATRRVVGASVSLAAIILVASTCGGEKSFSPPQPASISRSAGDIQTGTAGQPLPALLEVKVMDGSGAPVSGVSVSWFVVSGGGSVNPATSMTGSTGLAQTSWKLGRSAGANVVSASLPGSSLIPPITFSASGMAAAPSVLVFTVPPTTATAGGAMTPALQVAVQDSMGNTVTTATNNVTVAIGSNPAGGTLTGTASAAAAGGVATFSNLSINKAGTGYTLTASASGLTGATSAPFAVNAGAAAKLAFTTPPSNVTAGAAISPAVAVTVQDALGNTVTGASNGITLAIGTNPAGGTLGGTTNVAAVSGVATFSTLSVNKAGTGYTLTAAASGLAGATSGTFNVAVGSASQLVWTQQPSSVTAGSSMSPAVALTVADAQGNLVTTATGTVSLALTAAGGATLSGGGAATVANGVATFSALSVNKSGSYTLTPSTTVTGVTTLPVSGSFTVGAGTAAQIAVNAGNNQSAAGGTAVSVPPSVVVTDGLGNPVAGVSVTFGVASGGGTVVPTTAVTTNASGIAQVTSWTLGAASGTNTLTATSAGLTGSPVTFTATGTAGAATQIAINAGNNQSATAGAAVTVPPSVIVRDGNGNPVSGVSVTFAVASGGGTVVPTTAVTTNASGIAQATSWTLGATAGPNTLTATSAGLTGSPLTFSATGTVGAATQIALKAGSGQSATVGTAVATQPSVVVTDAHGNPVSGASVTFAVATGGGTVVPTTAVTTNASGIAQVTSWTLGTTAGSNSLTATSAGLTGSPVTITATGTAGAAAQIAVNAGNNQSATVGSAVTTPPSVLVSDAHGNPVAGVSVTFAVASGGGTVVPTTAVTTNASGIAQVTSWTLGTTAGANTLTATSAGLTGSPLTFTASGTVGVATQIALNGGNNQTATAGTAVAVAPSVIVKDANNNPVAGELVTFAVATGGGTVVPTAAVTTNASGIAQATSWTLGTTAGANSLSASAPGLTGSPVTFTATGTAGTATQIAINAGNGQSATVGTAVAVPPSVIVKDANNNPVSGVGVTFAVATGGGAVVPTTAVTTNASGIAQVTGWTLGTAAGSNTLTATSAGLTGSPLTFTATGTAGTATQIAINAGNGQSATVGTAVPVPPSVIVKDANSNPVSGVGVTFAVATGGGAVVPTTAVTTNASGIAQVTGWTLGTTAGANTLTATSAGLTGSPLTFTAIGTAGAATQIAINAGNGQSATAGAAVAVPPSVIVRDAGNNPVSGVSVTFAVASGGGTVAPTTAVVTDAGGIAQATSWTLGTSVGANSLTATSAGLTGSPVTFTATGTAGAATQIAVNAGNNQTATVGTAVGVAPSVIVRDVNNNPVSGVSVTFAVSSGGGAVVPTTAVTTDAGGIAQATSWTLGATAGTNTVTAVSGSLAGSPVTFTATGTPGAVSAAQSTVVASPTTIAAGGTGTTITVTAKDANGNPVSGATVVLAATGLGNTLVEPAALTDVNGAATGTLTSTKAEAKTVSATINSVAITQTAAVTVTAGPPSASLTTVAAAPPSIAAGGSGSTITVTAKDANGNPVSGATVVLASTGTGNTVTQPASPTDVNGVATGTLTSTVAEAKTVSATVNAVAITQTAVVTVTAGAASQIAVSAGNNQSATVGTAVTVAPATVVKDASGNPVSGVSVTFAVATGGGTVVPTTAVTTNASGIAQATSWTLGPLAGSNTLTATSAGLTGSPVTFTATGTAAAAAKLAVGTAAAGAVNGVAFGTQPVVLIQDAAGNTVTTDNTSIVTMGVSAGATTVGATLTATAVAGVATFSGVGISGTVGTPYTLTFTSGSLTSATQQITPALGAASKLAVTTPAAGAVNGAAFGTQPVVTIQDAGGNTVTSSTLGVTMSVSAGATTVGTVTVAAVSGVATFSGVGISGTAGTPYTLTFASGGLTSATQSITPSLGAAAQLALATAAAGAASGAAFTTQPVVAIKDAGGNTITTDNSTVVTMTVGAGATTVPATATATAVNGLATFSGVGINGVAGTPYTLTYTSTGLTQTTQSITPTPGAATQMVLTTPAAGAVNGSAFTTQPIVTLKDAAGNTTTASGATVTMAVSPGATVVGSGTATTVSGVATFNANGISGTVGTPYTLTFSSGVLTPVTQQITPTVGLAAKLALSTQAAGAASGSAFTTQPVVVVQDAGGNTVTTSTATVTMTVSTGATTVPATATATAVNGVATFTGVGISGIAGTPYTLSFGSSGLTAATQPITPTFGLANKLALTRAAAGAVNGAAFSTQPIVTIQDATGNTVTNDNSTVVTMAVSAGATLVGSGTATAIGGVATFAGVGLTGKVGTAYTLTFTSAPAYTQTTQSISPAIGAATQLVLTTPAAGAVNGANFTTQPVVAIQDAGGNTVTTAPATVITMTVTGGATTVGTVTRTTTSGVAAWGTGGVNVGITGVVGTQYTLSFAGGTYTSATQTISPTIGAAAKLAVTRAAAGAVIGSAFSTQPQITVQDAGGNTVTTSTATVTMTVSAGATTLPASATATAVAGVATFSGVGLATGVAGTQYTLTYGGTGLTSATQTITPTGTGTQLALTRSAAGAAAGAAFTTQPIVQIRDASNTLVVGDNSTVVTVAASGADGKGAIVGTASATAVAGVVTFTNVGITGTAGQVYTLTYTSLPVMTQATQTITPTFGPATQLFITTAAATATSGLAFGTEPVVTVQDAGGNTVTNSSASVTMAVSGADGKATTLGTVTKAAVNGVANFTGTGAGINGTVGQTYTLTYSSGTLSTVTQTISPALGAAAKLVITTGGPASSGAGAAFSPQPVVAIADAGGNTVTTSTAQVAMGVSGGDGKGIVVGTTPVTAVAGVATFTNIGAAGTSGTAYVLTYSSAGLASALDTVTMTVGPATKLGITRLAAGAAIAAAFQQQPIVAIQDAGGNTVTTAPATSITVAVSAGATLQGTTSRNSASGVATFTNVGLATGVAGTPYTLTFSGGTFTSATQTITPLATGATKLVLTTQPSTAAASGSALATQPVVQLQDASSANVASAGVLVTATASPGGATLTNATATTNASGQATFSGLTITGTAASYTLTFTSSGLTSATATAATALATRLSLTTQPPSRAASGNPMLYMPVVQLQDANNANVAVAGVTVTAAIASGSGTITNNTAVSDGTGAATFSGLTLTGSGTDSLKFTSGTMTAAGAIRPTTLATKLVITAQPGVGAVVGRTFNQPFVQVQDAGGNPVDSTGVTVTADVTVHSGGVILAGNTTSTAFGNTAFFSALAITGASPKYTLVFSAGGLTPATAAAPTQIANFIAFKTAPSSVAASGVPFAVQPVVQLVDSSGAVVAVANYGVLATLVNGTAAFADSQQYTDATGTATFNSLSITPTGTLQASYQLRFSTDATPVITGPVMPVATQLALTTQPPLHATSGVALSPQPVVQLQDSNGSSVSLSGVVITPSVSSGTATITNPVTATTASNGRGTFAGLALTGANGTNALLRFSAGTMTPVVANAATAIP